MEMKEERCLARGRGERKEEVEGTKERSLQKEGRRKTRRSRRGKAWRVKRRERNMRGRCEGKRGISDEVKRK